MDALTIRTVKVFDGLYNSFRLLEHHYGAMYESCGKITNEQDIEVIATLAHCWGFVDVLHRLRELAQVVPGLRGKTAERRLFLDNKRDAEMYRHYIQHLRQEVSQSLPTPVWGSLSWIDPNDAMLSHTAMIGSRLPGVSYTGSVFDTEEDQWVSRVSLGIGQTTLNFDPMFEEAKRFENFILPWMMERLLQLGTTISNELPRFSARIVLADKVDAE